MVRARHRAETCGDWSLVTSKKRIIRSRLQRVPQEILRSGRGWAPRLSGRLWPSSPLVPLKLLQLVPVSLMSLCPVPITKTLVNHFLLSGPLHTGQTPRIRLEPCEEGLGARSARGGDGFRHLPATCQCPRGAYGGDGARPFTLARGGRARGSDGKLEPERLRLGEALSQPQLMADLALRRSLDQSPPAVPSHLSYPVILNALSGSSRSSWQSVKEFPTIFQHKLFVLTLLTWAIGSIHYTK